MSIALHISSHVLTCTILFFPVKNMTWILMEIPCDFMSQIDGSLVQIDIKFHDYSMSFIQVLFIFHAKAWHGFWTSSRHEISMAFAKKMLGFPSDLKSFSTKLPSKRHEKIRVTFFTGYVLNTYLFFIDRSFIFYKLGVIRQYYKACSLLVTDNKL